LDWYKAHYTSSDFPEGLVQLHNFEGGYCGLSKTETGSVNFCYLAHYDTFKKAKSIEDFNQKILSQNPYLKSFLENSEMDFEKHLAISQVSFQNKKAVEQHMLMAGDSAGLIHPLCGNGMAMAIHSAKLVSNEIKSYFEHKDRDKLEANYSRIWKKTFQKRLIFGSIFQKILLQPQLTRYGMWMVLKSPFLLKKNDSANPRKANSMSTISTKKRSKQEEIMDGFDFKGEDLKHVLATIDRINTQLGGHRATIEGIKTLLKDRNQKHLVIADLGCGSGDALRHISKWAKSQDFNLQLIGIDANPHTIEIARELSVDYKNISYRVIDVFSEDFEYFQADIITCCLTLHHFEDQFIEKLLPVLEKKTNTACSSTICIDIN